MSTRDIPLKRTVACSPYPHPDTGSSDGYSLFALFLPVCYARRLRLRRPTTYRDSGFHGHKTCPFFCLCWLLAVSASNLAQLEHGGVTPMTHSVERHLCVG